MYGVYSVLVTCYIIKKDYVVYKTQFKSNLYSTCIRLNLFPFNVKNIYLIGNMVTLNFFSFLHKVYQFHLTFISERTSCIVIVIITSMSTFKSELSLLLI